jgi:membrane-bound lytic murein transglycosylase D
MRVLRSSLGGLAVAVLLGACATQPPAERNDWPMVPSKRSAAARAPVDATAEPAAAPLPAAPSEPEASTDSLVSLPVPPDYTPMADLANVFDRIRLGYALPEVVNKSIDLQQRYFASEPDYLDRTFERAERYLYYVARELELRNMPLELAMLPVVESAYNPYAYSRARAAGIWQFIAPTATRHLVRVNWWQDGRRDIVDSTRAALDYLSELHTMFDGDWLLAIAAYNCGEMAVQRAVNRAHAAHKPADFFHLKLPRETRSYVPKVLAMARIIADPDRYGLEFTSIANRPYFAQVEIGGQIDLRVAANLIGASEDELHALNPAFNRWATDPDGPYHLLVPFEAAPAFARAVVALPPELRMPLERYRLQDGDTIAKLARDREITVPTIRMLNGTAADELHVGDDIVLPASRIAPLRAGLIIEGETPLPGHRRHTYVVRRGDTLATIARRNGVGLQDLARLNGLAPHAHLTVGNRLIVEVRERHKRHRVHRRSTTSADDGAAHKLSQVARLGVWTGFGG